MSSLPCLATRQSTGRGGAGSPRSLSSEHTGRSHLRLNGPVLPSTSPEARVPSGGVFPADPHRHTPSPSRTSGYLSFPPRAEPHSQWGLAPGRVSRHHPRPEGGTQSLWRPYSLLRNRGQGARTRAWHAGSHGKRSSYEAASTPRVAVCTRAPGSGLPPSLLWGRPPAGQPCGGAHGAGTEQTPQPQASGPPQRAAPRPHSTVLATECLRPPTVQVLTSRLQCEGVWRQGLWEVTRS